MKYLPAFLAALALAGCASDSAHPATRAAVAISLHDARAKNSPAEAQAALYLQAAAAAAPHPGSSEESLAARHTYNSAAA